MSFASFMRTLGNIDCVAQSVTTYIDQKESGVSEPAAGLNLFANLWNGKVRNDIAYDMQRHGNSWGNVINTTVGYGSAEANAAGTIGLLCCNPQMWMWTGGMNYYSMAPFMGMGGGMPYGCMMQPGMGGCFSFYG